MQKTSVNFDKQTDNAGAHNARSGRAEKMDHLIAIIDVQKNECNLSAAAAGKKMRQLKIAANRNFKNYCGQKNQSKNYKWEAAVVIERHHTLSDVEKLAKAIEKEYGFTSTQISVHKDEGHIDEQGNYHYNNHAHLNFFTLDQTTGKQLMNLKNKHSKTGKLRAVKTDTTKMQDIAAEVLGMERGTPKKTTGAEHTSGGDLRKAHQAKKIADKYGDQYKKQLAQIEQEYTQTRADLKATGKAIQKDYSRLKTGKIKAIKELDNEFKQQGEKNMISTTLKPRTEPLTDEQKRQREHEVWEPTQNDLDVAEKRARQQQAEEQAFKEQATRELEEEWVEEERLQQVKDLKDQLSTARNEQAEKQKRQIHECTYQGKVIGRIIDDGDELKSLGFQSEKAAAYNLLKMAKDKDWNNITLKGSDEFVAAAIEYANKQDIQLKLTDEQERIRQELEQNNPAIGIDEQEKSLKSQNTNEQKEQTPLQEQDEKEQQYINKLHYQKGIEQERTQEREQLLQDKEEYTRKEQEYAESNDPFDMEKHLEGRAEEKRINENLEITPLEEAYNELMKEWVIDDGKEKIDLEDLRIVRENLEQEKRMLLDKQQLERYYHDEAYRHKDKNNGNLNDDNQTNTDTQEKNKNALNRKFKP